MDKWQRTRNGSGWIRRRQAMAWMSQSNGGLQRQWQGEGGQRDVVNVLNHPWQHPGRITSMRRRRRRQESSSCWQWQWNRRKMLSWLTNKTKKILLRLCSSHASSQHTPHSWPMRALPCFCYRQCLTTWRMVSLATSNFKNPASIMACKTLTSSGLEDPHGRFDLLLVRGTILWHVGKWHI